MELVFKLMWPKMLKELRENSSKKGEILSSK